MADINIQNFNDIMIHFIYLFNLFTSYKVYAIIMPSLISRHYSLDLSSRQAYTLLGLCKVWMDWLVLSCRPCW